MLHKTGESLLQILKKYVHFYVSTISCRFKSCQTWSATRSLLWPNVKRANDKKSLQWTFFKIYILLIIKQLMNLARLMRCIVINHLNKAFQDAMSGAERQSIDEHLTKFKGRMSCQQYMKNNPIKRCFWQWWQKRISVCVWSLFWQKGKKQSLALGKQLFWTCLRHLKIHGFY